MSKEKYDVIIIGAGLSGLSAATKLKEINPDVKLMILEAGDRVGGRTYSIPVNDGKDRFDLGAHWVGNGQTGVLDLMEKFGITHRPQLMKGTKFIQVGDDTIRTYESEIPNLNSWIALLRLFFLTKKLDAMKDNIDEKDPLASKLIPKLEGHTLGSFVRSYTNYKSIHDFMEIFAYVGCGCNMDQVSLNHFLSVNSTGQSLFDVQSQAWEVEGGTQVISEKLAENIGMENVQLSKKVSEITELQKNDITVSCTDGSSYNAKFIICTTPPKQVGKIKFDPQMPLPRRLYLEKELQMGNLVKTYIFYETSFWIEDGYSGEMFLNGGTNKDISLSCDTEGPITFGANASTPNGTHALVVFHGGKISDQWMDQPKEVRKAAIIKQLVKMFGSKAEKPIDYLEYSWRDNEFIEGYFAYGLPGSTDKLHYLRQPHGSVFFAGTETSLVYTGYMEGAIQSGYRAGAEIAIEIGMKEKLSEGDLKSVEDAQKIWKKNKN